MFHLLSGNMVLVSEKLKSAVQKLEKKVEDITTNSGRKLNSRIIVPSFRELENRTTETVDSEFGKLRTNDVIDSEDSSYDSDSDIGIEESNSDDHDRICRTVSDTLAAEFAEYVTHHHHHQDKSCGKIVDDQDAEYCGKIDYHQQQQDGSCGKIDYQNHDQSGESCEKISNDQYCNQDAEHSRKIDYQQQQQQQQHHHQDGSCGKIDYQDHHKEGGSCRKIVDDQNHRQDVESCRKINGDQCRQEDEFPRKYYNHQESESCAKDDESCRKIVDDQVNPKVIITEFEPGNSGYNSKLEFALKLGYTEDQVQLALQRLGTNPSQNELLEELIKLSSSSNSRSTCDLDFDEALSWDREECKDSENLRHIVVDGSNVAMR